MWLPRYLRRHTSLATFVPFLFAVFFWDLAFGGLKFLIKNLTVNHLSIGPGLLLEHVVGYLSIGGIIAYLIGGIVCHCLSKRLLIFLTAVGAILALVAEYRWGLASETSLAVTSAIIGLCFGLFSVVRTVVSCYEIKRTGLCDTTVNGLVMLIVIMSTLLGAFVSAWLFEQIGIQTLWVFVGFFVVIGLFCFWLCYRDEEQILPFRKSVARVRTEFSFIARHRYMIVVPSAALWAIAMIVSIKSIPYAQHAYGIRESMGSIALISTAVGAVLGNAITLWTCPKRRWFWFRVATYTFAALVVLFPVLTQTFRFMLLYSLFIGTAMGAATNLVDSAYLQFISANNVKENGAAIMGLALNIFVGLLLLILRFVPPVLHFVFLGGVAVAMGFFVLATLHILNGEIREKMWRK